MVILQQINGADTTSVAADGEGALFFFELILKGGFWLIPIVALSIVAIYIFFERLRSLNRASRTPFEFMDKIKDLVGSGDVNGAKLLCSQTDSPIAKMIEKIIEEQLSPIPQQGAPVLFKRRKEEDGKLNQLSTLTEVYNYIRMLDAEGYPSAFVETEHFVIKFKEAKFCNASNSEIQANVIITKK